MRLESATRTLGAAAVLLGGLLLACGATADDETELPTTVRVNGDASVSAAPDQVVIDVGVVSESEDADRAARANAEKVDAVLAELRRVLGKGSSNQLRTLSYSLSPKYAPYRQGVAQRIEGYVATNVVQVESDDLDAVGELIDAALGAGANRIQELRFVLRDEQPVRARALREATLRARGRADAIASALGLRVRRVVSVDESHSGPIPQHSRQLMQASAETATEVIPGDIEVRESVTMSAELGD